MQRMFFTNGLFSRIKNNNDQKEVKMMNLKKLTAFVIFTIMFALTSCHGGNVDSDGNGGNQSPRVIISQPSDHASFLPDANINISATATDDNGITALVIQQGSTILCESGNTFLNCVWRHVPLGNYALTAIATDTDGATGACTVHITISNTPPVDNQSPEVTVTSPANGFNFPDPANFAITAYAFDPDDSVNAVQFWLNDQALGTDNTFPYTINVTNLSAGRYVIWARATDSRGASGISQLVVIEVGDTPLDNSSPIITIISPADSTNYPAPASFNVGATVIDPDGDAITSVQLMQGTTVLATLNAEPYTISVGNLPAGNYTIWGRATDSQGNVGISNVIKVSVTMPPVLINNQPLVIVTSPADGATYTAPANFSVVADAIDPDGDTIASITFMIGGTVLGTDNTAPFIAPVADLPIGNYIVYARAVDSRGAIGFSQLVKIRVGTTPPTFNNPPVVVMITPADGATYTAPANLTVGAFASDPDGDAITRVEIMQGNTLLLSDLTEPYTISASNLLPGNYVFWARAIDEHGASSISQLIRVRVNNVAPVINNSPYVLLVSPSDGATYTAPTNLTVSAFANDPDGDAISEVQLWQGGTIIATLNAEPYNVALTNLPAGNYVFWARATDARGATGVSQLVQIRVGNPAPIVNTPPNVLLNTPGDEVSYLDPANFNVGADVVDPDGDIITQVELMQGNTVLIIDTTAPYTIPINNLPVGNYTYWARATDIRGGVGVSQLVRISVVAAPPVVDNPPLVIITSPADGATYLAPANFNVTADVIDPDNDAIASVTFMNGSTVLGTDNISPYSVPIVNMPIGNYVIYARATDARGATGVSQLITVHVGTVPPANNSKPFAVIVSPADGATYTAPADFIISAYVTDPDGDAITGVEFLVGNTVINTDNTEPYTGSVTNLPTGNYTLWVRVTDNRGAVGISPLINILVQTAPPVISNPPVIVIVSPADGATYTAPADFIITADALDPDGDAIIDVTFLMGSTVLGTDNTVPYSVPVINLPVGNYVVYARATDARGAVGISQLLNIHVGIVPPGVNNQPVVVMVSPADGATYTAPANLTVGAFASDPDGDAIAGVEFLMGNTVLGIDMTEPYSVSVTNLPAGSYAVWARATDNRGAVGISQPITIHIGNLPPSVNHDPLVILVSPAAGANYAAAADFYAQALVVDPDGDAITGVEFLVGNSVVATDNTAPFSMPVKLRSAGLYTVWARATDSRGGIGMSEVVSVNVTQPAANALTWCYTSPPTSTMGQAASLDPNSGPETGAWLPYRDLSLDPITSCVSIPQIDGRIPYIWIDGTYGPAVNDQWFGASIAPSSIWVNGAAYTSIQFFPYVMGVGSGYFVCLTDDCGLQSGYGQIIIQLFADADKDGTPNTNDNCQIYANDQLDSNSDGVGDACDGRDSDNDAYRDYDDAFPNDPLQH